MSKKKANTMTLKDFHGGSIPSDLPLPSAPGVVVRPSDRSFDRQTPTAWGNPIGRSDHRLRPGSSGATRSIDDKASLLSHPARIGRNFDEDERKPLDGVSVPRRTVGDESIRLLPSRPELKTVPVSTARLSDRQVSSPISNFSSASTSLDSVRHAGMNSQVTSGTDSLSAQSPSSYPNAWGTRKEVLAASEPRPSSAWFGPDAASRFAQASAVEVVSSGRWQPKHLVHHQPDAEVATFYGSQADLGPKENCTYGCMDLVNERRDYNGMQEKHARHVAEDGIWGGVRQLSEQERPSPLAHLDAKERNPPCYVDGVQQGSADGTFGGPHMQSSVPSEVSERPKLKLLPRSKPVENLEPSTMDYNKQRHQQPYDSAHVETIHELYGDANPPKPGSSGSEASNQIVERPKLNLKPRTQPPKQLEGAFQRERNTLFGGARPREMVLKDRGIDDVAINNLELSRPPNRVKAQTMLESGHQTERYSDRAENLPLNQKIIRSTERKDHRPERDRTDMQKMNWRNENRKNVREMEKQQQQQEERRPEPETWRKSVESPTISSADVPGLHYGKTASALELAQAFSRSVSDVKKGDHFCGPQKGVPRGKQMPFSRLTDTRELHSHPVSRSRINSY